MSLKHILTSFLGILVLLPFLVQAFPFLAGASQTYVVTSGSMAPSIPTGSVIWVSDINPSMIEEGDVITFSQGSGNTVTHRVVNKTMEGGQIGFKTKGDANSEPDPGTVNESQLEGKVSFSIPYLGYISEWMSSSFGLLALVVLPALGILGLELFELYENMKEKQEEGYSGF